MLAPGEALVLLAILTVTPGLDTLLTLRQAANRGQTAAIWTAVGITFGLLVQTAVAGAGLSILIAESPRAFTVLKTLGGLYLLYLGVSSLLAAFRPHATVPDAAREGAGDAATAFTLGFVTNALNPKVVLFYLTFLPLAAPRNIFLEASVLYGCAHAMMGLLWLGSIIAAAEAARRFLDRPQVRQGIDLVAGLLFILFGILAWLS